MSSSISKKPNGMEGMEEIMELARLLRKNGDTVLSGQSKLSLSTRLLQYLNDAFSIVVDDSQELDSSFRVCNNSKIDVFGNVNFLHDFVQKIVWLKVSQHHNDPKYSVDITKFRHLRYLELQKVCIDLVSGIQAIRGQLENITCTGGGGVGTVGRLLAACGRDNAGVGFVWASLKRLALPYNSLGRLDKSLELAPWLQTLDFSHNLIVTANELDSLPNLKYVNFGYNKLESPPLFNMATHHTLQTLVLKNNYIENLNGLQHLDCLLELDLSYNCLTEHSILWPLQTMSALMWITLEGNPLSYHKKHRLLTVEHLHSALSESKFVLDHEPLSKTERIQISHNRIFMIRTVRSPSKDDTLSLTRSIQSDVISPSVENPHDNDLMISQRSEITDTTERNVTRNKIKNYVSEAVITDDDNDENLTTNMTSSIGSSSWMETSAEHLETKKKILALRKKFGDEQWLVSQAGSYVQDIMGLEKSTVPTLASVSGLHPTPKIVDATNVTNFLTDISYDSAIWSNDDSIDDVTASSTITTSEKNQDQENDATLIKSDSEKTIMNEADEETEYSEETPNIVQVPCDPDDDNAEIFLVQKKSNDDEMEDIFLVISPDDIKERDSLTGNVKYRWSTDTVLSCVLGRGETSAVDLIFDTSRKDREKRTYFVEEEDATKIVKILGDLIKAHPLVMNVFTCMKCSTHFSHHPDFLIGRTASLIPSIDTLKCPTCRSDLVIQTDELLTPDNEDVKKDLAKSPSKGTIDDIVMSGNLQHSESHSSIGGTEGGAIPVTNSQVQFDSRTQAQVSCSATSLEDSRESTPSASTVTKRYESDIEILSNPSQSSIEVLDDGTKAISTPNRKRSSEERRVANAPTLLTIPDTPPVMAGLTESSSSGSLTDSICTTYENKVSRSSGSATKRQNKKTTVNETMKNSDTSKDAISTSPVANFSSMLGGLLQSMKIGTHKGPVPKPEEGSDFAESVVEYSYEDFGSVDHRIKLYLILNVYEQEKEDVLMLLRAQMVMQDSTEPFQACLIFSTYKVYVLKIIGPESGDPKRWLHKETSWTNEKLRYIAPLPFKQGILLKFQQLDKHHDKTVETTIVCILQDFKRTSNLLYYLTGIVPTSRCEIDSTAPHHCTAALKRSILSSVNCDQPDMRYLAFFTEATYTYEESDVKLNCGCLIVTNSAVFLTGEKIKWLLAGNDETPNIVMEHSISNLIEVSNTSCRLEFSFIDEEGDVEDTWRLVFVSYDAAKAVINAIEGPWEELFSVPLQVSDIELECQKLSEKK